MRNTIFAAVAAVGLMFTMPAAQALTITSPGSLSLINLGTGNGSGLQNSNDFSAGGASFNITAGGSPKTGLYSGSTATSTSPFGDFRNYLSVQPKGEITITFATDQTSFALLWGTVDTFNSLSFLANGVTVTGTQVATALGFTPASGNLNKNVLISDIGTFKTIVVKSSDSAFEFVPGSPTAVPEPLSIAMLGAGLLGLGAIRKARKQK